ncbi:methyl-accepting chemotaxis protein, partial [Arthrospira platensis SPKY1]|nr:methyl-accepting chemotaxis protein [Arthrospira platensis SPKY1]
FAQGDLIRSVKVDTDDEIGRLSHDMERFRESLKSSLVAVRQSAQAVSTGSQEIASGNNDLSQRTESQASALEETAASMEQMGSTVRHNAYNAAAANQLATQASAVA